MGFLYHPQRPKQTRQAQIIAAVISTIAATSGVVASIVAPHKPGAHGGTASTNMIIVIATVVALIVVMLAVGRNLTAGAAKAADSDASDGTGSGGGAADNADEDRKPFMLVIAVIGALVGLVVMLFVFSSTAHAQGASDRGALFIRNGNDTIVTDRFIRAADTLRGRSQVKGQPPVEYAAVLGTNNAIKTLAYNIYAPGAKDGDKPAARLLFTMSGDSAIVEIPSGTQRVATKAGAIPMMSNMLALGELFTRRAKAAGGSLEIPRLVVAGGATIMVSVNAFGADSMSVRVGPQEQRFRIDAIGRILGGTIAGTKFEFVRGGPETAGTLKSPVSTAATVRDYSAPAGAPYTAEEVKVHTIAGFDLGGTLTKPKNESGRLPAVVTITGSGQEDRDEMIPFAGGIRLYRELADTLSRRGIVVLRLDDRGLGASGGDASMATTADFANDIRAAIAYLRSRPDIDPNRIALAGHSEGGIIAPMIAATDPKIHAIVILAGTSERGSEILAGQQKYGIGRIPSLTQTQRDSMLAAAHATLVVQEQKVPWFKFFADYDPAVALKKVRVPTLYIQGETDHQVPADQAEMGAKLIRSNGNKDVTVRLFPATSHLFVPDSTGDFTKYDQLKSNRIRPEVLGAIADWLAIKLGASSAVVK
jgi:hypothetical protein